LQFSHDLWALLKVCFYNRILQLPLIQGQGLCCNLRTKTITKSRKNFRRLSFCQNVGFPNRHVKS
jgi:hypothetical protein